MKKIGKGLLLILLLFIVSINSVNASIEKGKAYNSHQNGSASVNGLTYSTVYFYKFTDSDGGDFTGYCLDPHKVHGNNYKVDHILGSRSDSRLNALDYGILEILKNGCTKYSCNFAGVSGNNLSVATSIAVRAFSLGLFGFGGGEKDVASYKKGIPTASANVNAGYEWASLNPQYSNNILSSSYSYYGWVDKEAKFVASSDVGSSVLSAAQQLFNLGLKTASNYLTTGEVSVGTVTATSKSHDTTTENSQTKEIIPIDIKIENLRKDGSSMNGFTWSCPNCSVNGVTFDRLEYKDGSTWKILDSTTNVLQNVSADSNGYINTTIKIRAIVYKKDLSEDNTNFTCTSPQFTIKYKYIDPNREYIGALLTDKENTTTQRFYIIEKVVDANGNPIPVDDEISGKISCPKSQPCSADIKNPICSTNEEEATGEYYAGKDATNNDDIKKCVISSTDEAGNSYELYKTTDGSGNSVGGLTYSDGTSNPYCSVYCKEDYASLKMNPLIEEVECGGYFKLSSHIEGTKSCYTGNTATTDKSIDTDAYLEDVIQAQKDMIEHYSNWLNYKTAYDNIYSVKSKCGGGCCSKTDVVSYYTSGDNKNNFVTTYTKYYVTNVNKTTGEVSFATKKDSLYSDKEESSGGCKGEKDEITGICSSSESSCSSGDKEKLQKRVKALMDAEKNAIYDAYKRFVNANRNINACTTGWENIYQFEQKIKYYYNEYQDGLVESPYYPLLALETDDYYYLEGVKSSEEVEANAEKHILVCEGTVDKAYNTCSTGWKEMSSTADENASWSKYLYNTNYSSVFKQRTFSIVDIGTVLTADSNKDGIEANISMKSSNPTAPAYQTVYVSQAQFVKKTVNKEQDYITPTVFYQVEQNGKIAVKSGYATDKLDLEELKEKLPTSSKLVGGGQFKLYIEKLGEFYNTGELGRIYDFVDNDTVITKDSSLVPAEGTVGAYYGVSGDTFNGEYSCWYESSCVPDDEPNCPQCKWECSDDNDCSFVYCPTCNFTCLNCIFDFDQLNVTVKTISTTNVKSAKRTYGYNWITSSELGGLGLLSADDNSRLDMVAEKAEETVSEIEATNETIYNNKTSDSSTGLAFSIKMDSHVIEKLKNYNTTASGSGGYINDTLNCYDYSSNGNVYSNIFCYSEVIDDLISDPDVEYIGLTGRINDTNQRSSQTQNSGYWSVWDKVSADFVYGETTISDGSSKTVIGGPSWK